MIEFLPADDAHYIKQLRFIRKNSDCELSWQCSEADYFLVIARSAVSPTKTSEILNVIDTNIINSAEHNGIYEHHDAEIYFVSREAFFRRNKTYIVPLRRNQPLAINVFACSRDTEGKVTVYTPSDPDSGNVYVQEIINVVLRESRLDRFFFFKKTIRLHVRVDAIENYSNDFLMYYFDGGKVKYPLTAPLVGKSFLLNIPKGKNIIFCLADDYVKLYKLNVSYILK